MKLIIVARSKTSTYARLREQFADDPNVTVVFERRTKTVRQEKKEWQPERRQQDRRRLQKVPDGKDYVVIHMADRNANKNTGGRGAKTLLPIPLHVGREAARRVSLGG